jgi:GTP-binding protein
MSVYPTAQFLISAAAASQFPADTGAEVAIAGRSNAGKSSAINAITGRRALARISKTPGRTRLLNFFQLAPTRRLVDLPGYGYATAPAVERQRWGPLIDALAQRASFRGLLVVVDARRGLLEGDEALLAWAEGHGHAVHVLLSKADKLTRSAATAVLARTSKELGPRASAQLFSAHTLAGVDESRQLLDRWLP